MLLRVRGQAQFTLISWTQRGQEVVSAGQPVLGSPPDLVAGVNGYYGPHTGQEEPDEVPDVLAVRAPRRAVATVAIQGKPGTLPGR